ncbi:hypothetical protein BD309DRAFT_875752 [Dichomitus squalens]|nr:hypothetical protein BD309DRAFT_875752 [Dichomitus squalens]
MVMKFLRTWSQYFTEHLAPVVETIPEYDLPLHIDMPSNRERVAYMRSKLTPILFHTFPLENIPYSIFSPFPVNRVDVYLTGQQVLVLYQRLSLLFRDFLASRALSSEDFKEVVKLSRQDVLSAFIVTAISVSRGEPITQVTNVVNCRGFNPAIVPEDAAGNALLYALTDIVQSPGLDRESLGGTIISYAHAIRLSLQAAREPQYVHDFLALAGQEWLAAARANRGHYIAETPGHVVINSYYRIDWASVHFGSPGKVCWQHPDHIMTDNYIMMFPSNPTRGNHGVWRTDDGACEMTFNVKKGVEEKLEVALALLWDVVVGSPSGPAFKTSQVAF